MHFLRSRSSLGLVLCQTCKLVFCSCQSAAWGEEVGGCRAHVSMPLWAVPALWVLGKVVAPSQEGLVAVSAGAVGCERTELCGKGRTENAVRGSCRSTRLFLSHPSGPGFQEEVVTLT